MPLVWTSPCALAAETTRADWTGAIAQLIQALAILAGGLWALYLYKTSRRGRASIGIEGTARLHSSAAGADPLLLVHLRITNRSNVLFCNEGATAYLMDASGWTSKQQPLLLPLASQDPFLPVYGEISDSIQEVVDGKLFSLGGVQITLDPGEGVDTELAFPISALGLFAMLVRIQGYERGFPIRMTILGRELTLPGRPPSVWGTFFFIDTERLPAPIVQAYSTPAPDATIPTQESG